MRGPIPQGEERPSKCGTLISHGGASLVRYWLMYWTNDLTDMDLGKIWFSYSGDYSGVGCYLNCSNKKAAHIWRGCKERPWLVLFPLPNGVEGPPLPFPARSNLERVLGRPCEFFFLRETVTYLLTSKHVTLKTNRTSSVRGGSHWWLSRKRGPDSCSLISFNKKWMVSWKQEKEPTMTGFVCKLPKLTKDSLSCIQMQNFFWPG